MQQQSSIKVSVSTGALPLMNTSTVGTQKPVLQTNSHRRGQSLSQKIKRSRNQV